MTMFTTIFPTRCSRQLPLIVVAIVSVMVGRAACFTTANVAQIHDSYGPCEAQQVHIALTSVSTEMLVQWKTFDSGCDNKIQYQAVAASAKSTDSQSKPSGLLMLESGVSSTITENQMCSSPATDDSFSLHLHTATLVDLEPDRKYEFQINEDDDWRSFISPPKVSAQHEFTFIAFGDMGAGKHVQDTIATNNLTNKSPGAHMTADSIREEVERGGISLVLHIGDLSYADGDYTKWDRFMQLVEPIASRVPYMIGIGNHEYDYYKGAAKDPSGTRSPYHPPWGNYGDDSGGECGAMAAVRFVMPSGGPVAEEVAVSRRALAEADLLRRVPPNPPFWYSFEYGSVHFTVISTEHDIQEGSLQARWISADLAAVDRCRTPWLIVALHRPMYVVLPHKDNRIVGEHIRQALEPLLVRYDVDATISGHVHSYSRTCAVYNQECVREGDAGITHFIIGSAGHKLADVETDQDEWFERGYYNSEDFGYGRFTVRGEEEMEMEFVASENGRVLDSVTLRRSAHARCGVRAPGPVQAGWRGLWQVGLRAATGATQGPAQGWRGLWQMGLRAVARPYRRFWGAGN